MRNKITLLFLSVFSICTLSAQQRAEPDMIPVKGGTLTIQPITHATLVLSYKNKHVYVDPTGGADAFKGLAEPTIILITDIHGDHFDLKTIEAIITKNTVLVVPQAVADKLPASIQKRKIVILKNGDDAKKKGIHMEALPMYNLPEAPDSRHPKGRGNGYIVSIGGKNIYLSGDTEAISEMRALTGIDIAFVCMNLPYTMDVKQAAEGVLAFKPNIVYPYHYRGQDVTTFKQLVNAGNNNIEVRLKEWYPAAKK